MTGNRPKLDVTGRTWTWSEESRQELRAELQGIVNTHVAPAERTLEQMPAVDWSPLDAAHLTKAQAILREVLRRLPLAADLPPAELSNELADLDRGLGVAYVELDKLRLYQSPGPTLDAVVQAMGHIHQAHGALL